MRIFVAKLCAGVANVWKCVADGGIIVANIELAVAKLYASDSTANAVAVGRDWKTAYWCTKQR